MPRPTRSEIDAEIVDRAAALFARHGYTGASLQQIADAMGYSKAGLLHHYPSKRAVYEAAVEAGSAAATALLAEVGGPPVGPERDRAVVEAALRFAYARPGVSALLNRIAEAGEEDPALVELGLTMLRALGIDPGPAPGPTPGPGDAAPELGIAETERIVRITCAFAGLGIAAAEAVRLDLRREWRGSIVAAAMGALGHGTIDHDVIDHGAKG